MLIIRILFSLLLVTLSGYAVAAEPEPQNWYQVELILFKQPYQAIASTEQLDLWSRNRHPINYDQSIEIRYPKEKMDLEEQGAADNLETDQPVVSLKEAQSIVAESLQPTEPLQERAQELQPFTFAKMSNWELGSLFERLKGSEQYELLLHTAWIQPGLDKNEAKAVHIQNLMALVPEDSATTGDAADLLPNENESVTPETKSALLGQSVMPSGATSYPLDSPFFEQGYQQSLDQSGSESGSEPPTTTLNGTLKVILARYLHVELDLEYAPLGFPQEIGNTTIELVDSNSQNYAISGSSVTTGLLADGNNAPLLYNNPDLENILSDDEIAQKVVYRLQESRRMRSRELHYIDHPKIGALIKIIPVALPQADEVASKAPDPAAR